MTAAGTLDQLPLNDQQSPGFHPSRLLQFYTMRSIKIHSPVQRSWRLKVVMETKTAFLNRAVNMLPGLTIWSQPLVVSQRTTTFISSWLESDDQTGPGRLVQAQIPTIQRFWSQKNWAHRACVRDEAVVERGTVQFSSRRTFSSNPEMLNKLAEVVKEAQPAITSKSSLIFSFRTVNV